MRFAKPNLFFFFAGSSCAEIVVTANKARIPNANVFRDKFFIHLLVFCLYVANVVKYFTSNNFYITFLNIMTNFLVFVKYLTYIVSAELCIL